MLEHAACSQLPLLPDDASKLLERLLEAELPAACASLGTPGPGRDSAAVVMRTVAQLVTVAAEAETLTSTAAAKLNDVAWRWSGFSYTKSVSATAAVRRQNEGPLCYPILCSAATSLYGHVPGPASHHNPAASLPQMA